MLLSGRYIGEDSRVVSPNADDIGRLRNVGDRFGGLRNVGDRFGYGRQTALEDGRHVVLSQCLFSEVWVWGLCRTKMGTVTLYIRLWSIDADVASAD